MALSCTEPGCSEQLVDAYATECPRGHAFDPDAAHEPSMRTVRPPEAAVDEPSAAPPQTGQGLQVTVDGRTAWGAAPLLLGRSPESPVSELFAAYDNVSRRHVRVSISGTTLEVRDQGSKNGTFVRQQRVQFEDVSDGEQIQLARNCFVALTIDPRPAPFSTR